MVVYCKASYLGLLTSLTGNLLYASVEWRPGQPIKSVQPPFAPHDGFPILLFCHMKHMHLTANVSLPVAPWSLLVVVLFFGYYSRTCLVLLLVIETIIVFLWWKWISVRRFKMTWSWLLLSLLLHLRVLQIQTWITRMFEVLSHYVFAVFYRKCKSPWFKPDPGFGVRVNPNHGRRWSVILVNLFFYHFKEGLPP